MLCTTEYRILNPKSLPYMISSTFKHTISSFWYSMLQIRPTAAESKYLLQRAILLTKTYNWITSSASSIHLTFYNQWTLTVWWDLLLPSPISHWSSSSSPAPHWGGQGHSMWDLWWTRGYWNRFLSKYPGLPPPVWFNQCSTMFTHSYTTDPT